MSAAEKIVHHTNAIRIHIINYLFAQRFIFHAAVLMKCQNLNRITKRLVSKNKNKNLPHCCEAADLIRNLY